MTKDDGGPAFAHTTTIRQDVDWARVPSGTQWSSRRDLPQKTELETSGGMSLLDWFAGQAMQGMVAAGVEIGESVVPAWDWTDLACERAATQAYCLADAMLTERTKEQA